MTSIPNVSSFSIQNTFIDNRKIIFNNQYSNVNKSDSFFKKQTHQLTSTKKKLHRLPRLLITTADLHKILQSKKKKGFSMLKHARCILTCVILYYTGSRLGEVGSLTLRNIEELIGKSETDFKVTKVKSKHESYRYHSYKIPTKGKEDLLSIQNYIDIVFKNQSTVQGSIQKNTYIKSTNLFLKTILGETHGKIAKSHSFRASRISFWLNNSTFPIHVVKNLIGHKSIHSTISYYKYSQSNDFWNTLDLGELQKSSFEKQQRL